MHSFHSFAGFAMFCCRRYRAPAATAEARVLAPAPALDSEPELDAEIESWWAAAVRLDPCPICFDEPESAFSYADVNTHSWSNHDRCDAHGICGSCMQRHVEVKLLDDGVCNIRCPGEGCRYQLLEPDLDLALGSSEHRARAKKVYATLRNQNGSLRLQSAMATAVDEGPESWVWRECQACPQCNVLAYRADGCSHLACRCGCHYCFVCGGPSGQIGGEVRYECCCCELELRGDRAYLAAWMCFKAEAQPAWGGCAEAVKAVLHQQMPRYQRELRRLERERAAEDLVRTQEEAAEAWARGVVHSTGDVLRARRSCESLGAALWRAGADVEAPLQGGSTEGLLASSSALARAEEEDEHIDEAMVAEEFDYDDVVGYVADLRGARALRRVAHGAPRRLCKEKAWAAGEKVQAKAPACARKQKQALVSDARRSVADARHIRRLRRAQKTSRDV